MGRAKFEAYPKYQAYLNQDQVWPSESSGFARIDDMVPRYASSAYSKLMRWAELYSTGVTLNIHDSAEREAYVRNSVLGRALLGRAHGINIVAVTDIADIPAPVTTLEFIQWLAPIVAAHLPEGETDKVIELVVHLTRAVDDTWTVTPKSR